jgi:hypothetical protein
MLALNKLRVGDVLYRVRREKAGHTDCRRDRVDEFTVTAIEPGVYAPKVKLAGYGADRVRVSTLRRSPPEWIQRDIFAPRTCYFCRAQEGTAHTKTCDHPAAEKARKAAEKTAKQAAQEPPVAGKS